MVMDQSKLVLPPGEIDILKLAVDDICWPNLSVTVHMMSPIIVSGDWDIASIVTLPVLCDMLVILTEALFCKLVTFDRL